MSIGLLQGLFPTRAVDELVVPVRPSPGFHGGISSLHVSGVNAG
jgi:hypothetical protein